MAIKATTSPMPVLPASTNAVVAPLVFYPRSAETPRGDIEMLGKNMADLKFVATEIWGGFGGKTVVYLEL